MMINSISKIFIDLQAMIVVQPPKDNEIKVRNLETRLVYSKNAI